MRDATSESPVPAQPEQRCGRATASPHPDNDVQSCGIKPVEETSRTVVPVHLRLRGKIQSEHSLFGFLNERNPAERQFEEGAFRRHFCRCRGLFYGQVRTSGQCLHRGNPRKNASVFGDRIAAKHDRLAFAVINQSNGNPAIATPHHSLKAKISARDHGVVIGTGQG